MKTENHQTKNTQNEGIVLKPRKVPQILFITSYPPRECGIATYSQDLISALNAKFMNSFRIKICALENDYEMHQYPKEVKYILNTQHPKAFKSLAAIINMEDEIQIVTVQHEFGFFATCRNEFATFLKEINKTKVMVFHTVLPNPDDNFRQHVIEISEHSDSIVVMTQRSKDILIADYEVPAEKISVIAHGTHLVPLNEKRQLKEKYGLADRQVLSTFGLLSSGKSIETTLDALPEIIRTKPDVMFLILGKTHPGIVKNEGEKYREFLEEKVKSLHLEQHVRFVNKYLQLDELLEYLQLTDIYLFTSKDPNQAVSGTFSYAASCGCAIVSTPIPHAREFLEGDCGIVIDFQNSKQLAEAVNTLLFDVNLRAKIKTNALHKIVSTAWENSALAHATLFSRLSSGKISLRHKLPAINLSHIRKMTTSFGMIQFSKLNMPDRESGYTLDDNARALIAFGQHYEMTGDESDLEYIDRYLDFINYCQQPDGKFLNYVSDKRMFTAENHHCNLEDSNGRAIWALGYILSIATLLPHDIFYKAEVILEKALNNIEEAHSPRAMAFMIKGLYYYNIRNHSKAVRLLIRKLADRLTQMYLHEATTEWQWFESYLTYANSVLPEALLYAYRETHEEMYKEVARNTFRFLLNETFDENRNIRVISNKNWYHRGEKRTHFGEQPVDVAYTILALQTFYNEFREAELLAKMEAAFEWFVGKNHLNQIIYNPSTGGCYDGLEQHNVNLNQGAESAISYLLARLCVEKALQQQKSGASKVIRLKQENYAFKVS
ncbi:MAG: glycosyltransferase [Flavobacterium sp.]|nr:MAG: glycosyltransferase [Flavobacterium sp.]